MSRIARTLVLAAGASLALTHAASAVDPRYSIADLGTLGGPWSNGLGINNLGHVVGQADMTSGGTGPFVYRDGQYIDAAGKSFRAFMDGTLDVLPGERPSIRDFSDHLTTAFPEVRLKKYLEMRGADGGPWNRICALSAYWVGLLYDDAALDAAWDLVKDFTLEERHALRDGVPRHGFKLPFRGATMRELAMESLKISEAGLKRRARLNRSGASEAVYLEPLIEMALANQTAAERKLELFHREWQGSVDPLFKEFAY